MSLNIAKEYCDCVISWEIQENRKISSIVHCSFSEGKVDSVLNSTTGTIYSIIPEETENKFLPILLIPFLHPEMTQATYCDLKVFISPKFGVKIDRLVIVSTAKVTEYFDRHGEMLFLMKGVKLIGEVESGKETNNVNKACHNKSPFQWFRSEYILSLETFEVMVRFCDYLTHNQLFIKYIGVKVVPHDWSVELGSINLPATILGSNSTGLATSTGNTCAHTVTINLDKVLEAIQNINSAVQLLNHELGFFPKGSNPHLATSSSFETSNLLKYRKPNSPKTSTTTSPSSNYYSGIIPRRNSDVYNLQLWLESHLTTIETTFSKGIEHLSSRISKLESLVTLPKYNLNDSDENHNEQISAFINNMKVEPSSPLNDSSKEKSSA